MSGGGGGGECLSGVKVVEMCQMISGPLAAQILADQGADVVKIENANGAGDRFRGGRGTPSPAFAFANRGKRSVTLDTKAESGLGALRKLVASVDVFLQNFRPGVADRMGIGYEAIKALNALKKTVVSEALSYSPARNNEPSNVRPRSRSSRHSRTHAWFVAQT